MMLKNMMRWALVVVAGAGICARAHGQSAVDGAIGGTVEDTSGSVIPGATVVVHSNTTNAEQTLTADGSGFFRAIHLQPSIYTVTISATGFGSYKSSGVIVQVGLLTDISPKLPVGSASQTVEVTSEAPTINTTSPDFSGLIDQKTLQDVPVNNYRWFRGFNDYDNWQASGVSGQGARSFYYPPKMFSDAQTTLNVLVTLEDAFIAAYLVGVRDFSTANLRVTAARIMGIESDHRTLARVVAPGVAAQDGGPVENVTGIQGKAESVDPPNNNGYERTLGWTTISKAVAALTPFADKSAAGKAGFDTSKPYQFQPFMPNLPEPLGEFHSFVG